MSTRSAAILALLAACGAAQPSPTAQTAAEGEALVARRCTTCHSESPIYGSVGSEADWHAVVHRMVYHHKAKLLNHITDDEAMAISHYLAETCRLDGPGVRIGPVPTGRPL